MGKMKLINKVTALLSPMSVGVVVGGWGGSQSVHAHPDTQMLILLCAVADAGATVRNLEQEADRLIDKLKPIKELEDNLKKNISEIKELINQARKQANSVRLYFQN